jgi:hypothetical protein
MLAKRELVSEEEFRKTESKRFLGRNWHSFGGILNTFFRITGKKISSLSNKNVPNSLRN